MEDPFDLSAYEPPSPLPENTAHAAPYLADLNDGQRQAVDALDGPVLVLAGAGTGKTRVLTTRLGHILFSRKAWPSQILAVTFTNKAAREMKDRITDLVGEAVEGLWLGTFHSIGSRIVRRHAELVGLTNGFTILDTDDQLRLLKQLLEANNIDPKALPPRVVAGMIDRWKNQGLTPDKVPPSAKSGEAKDRAVELYAAYQERLKVLNAVDFGDLLLHCLSIFQADPEVLKQYQTRFRYILVDEYQDSNVVQYIWLRLLAQGHRNICCVGDDDQSIYGWRGAEVGNILRFEKDFPGAKVIRLERNYRSTPHILGAASGIIHNNQSRLGKTLWTDRNDGEPITVRGLWDGMEEARAVSEEIEALQRAGERLSEMAILVRAGFQTRLFEDRFLAIGLPYRVVGGVRFYERREIRDAMAYLRLIAQPDDDLALERIINVPKRGLGDATMQRLHIAARAANCSLYRAAEALIETDELRPQARTALTRIVKDFQRWRGLLGAVPHTELTQTILDESGYAAMWQADRAPDSPGRVENLGELVRAMEAFDNLAGFLEHISLVMDTDTMAEDDKVSLMTLHAAKGLEFDTVFLPGWEEGLFPHQRALEENGIEGLEEERRLAYVGLTRARSRCQITFAASRQVFGQWQSSHPSRFVEELPSEHVVMQSDQGLYSGPSQDPSLKAHGAFAYDQPWLRSETRLADRGYQGGGYRRSAAVVEATARTVEDLDAPPRFGPGDRVFHQKFGYGAVKAVDGHKVEIEFDKAGTKRVIDAFLDPT